MDSPESKTEATTPSTIRSASAPATPAPTPPSVTPVTPRRWSESEATLVQQLIKEQKGGTVDWEEIARKLAEGSDLPEGATPRSAQRCYERWRHVWNGKVTDDPPASSAEEPTPSKARNAKRPSLYDIYETDLSHITRAPQGQRLPPWNEQGVAQLLAAVKTFDVPLDQLKKEDWEWIGAQITPPRSRKSCSKKLRALEKQKDSKASKPTELRASELTPPACTADSPPQDPGSDRPISISQQPFSAEDDFELLRLNTEHPSGLYKTISRLMHPKRHKKEVRDRLEQLLALEHESGSQSSTTILPAPMTPIKRTAPSSPSSEDQPPARKLRRFPPEEPLPPTNAELVGSKKELKKMEKRRSSEKGQEMESALSGEELEPRLERSEEEVMRLRKENEELGRGSTARGKVKEHGRQVVAGAEEEDGLILSEGGGQLAGTLEEALEGLRELSRPWV